MESLICFIKVIIKVPSFATSFLYNVSCSHVIELTGMLIIGLYAL